MSDRTRAYDSRMKAFLTEQAEEEVPVEQREEEEPEEEVPKKKKQRSKKGTSPEDKDPDNLKKEQEKHLVKYFPEKITRLNEVPEMFIEPEGPKAYVEDAFDRILPSGGFVSDYVNACRGIEAPTMHLVWAALWTVSSCLKREAWIRWYPDPLWPNLYVMLVAPPALCRKSSSMEIGRKLLTRLPDSMGSTIDAFKKETKFVSSKCTPEGLIMLLEPDKRAFIDEDSGKLVFVNKGSQVAIAVSELPTFLGRQQYNLGMVNLLLDLYDCKDKDDEITRGRGVSSVEEVYTTFIGAVTPEGMRLAVPEEAFGGGFMSRVIIAYQEAPTKIYAFPKVLPGYPTVNELLPKLAWIANVAKGEYYFTEEAMKLYEGWYDRFKKDILLNGTDRFEEYRLDTLLLKVACLLRIQEYRPGFDITEKNIFEAERILTATVRRSKAATEDVGAGEYKKQMNYVRRQIVKRGKIDRRLLLKRVSSIGMSATQLNLVLDQLCEEGFMKIWLQERQQLVASSQGDEIYELAIGEGNGS